MMGSELKGLRDLRIVTYSSMKAKYSDKNCKESSREKKLNPVFIPLYKSMQCPHLDHCVQFWSPISKEV